MNQEDIDKFVYAEAKNFLLDLCIAGVDSLLIEKYLRAHAKIISHYRWGN